MANSPADKSVSLTQPSAVRPVIKEIDGLIAQGRAAEAFSAMPQLDALRDCNPPIIDVTKGTFLIDIGRQLSDASLTKQGIDLISQIDVSRMPESVKSKHIYNLGNGYATLF